MVPFLLTLRNVSGTLPACKPAQILVAPASVLDRTHLVRKARRRAINTNLYQDLYQTVRSSIA
eukprot:2971394-Rhodomonas_salina.4